MRVFVFTVVFSLDVVVFVLDDNEGDEVRVKVQSPLLDFNILKKTSQQRVKLTYLYRFQPHLLFILISVLLSCHGDGLV